MFVRIISDESSQGLLGRKLIGLTINDNNMHVRDLSVQIKFHHDSSKVSSNMFWLHHIIVCRYKLLEGINIYYLQYLLSYKEKWYRTMLLISRATWLIHHVSACTGTLAQTSGPLKAVRCTLIFSNEMLCLQSWISFHLSLR